MGEMDFFLMLERSTLVIKIVLVVLVVLSVVSWSLMAYKWLQYRKARRRLDSALQDFQGAGSLREALATMDREHGSAHYVVARAGAREYDQLSKIAASDRAVVLDAVRQTLRTESEGQVERLFGSLSFLATTANAAPLLGLFGTVWGIMNSFSSFSGLQVSTIEAVAPGMAEALSTTALGLVVAIPATLAYNILLRSLSKLEGALGRFTSTFLYLLKKELAEK